MAEVSLDLIFNERGIRRYFTDVVVGAADDAHHSCRAKGSANAKAHNDLISVLCGTDIWTVFDR